MNLIYLLILVWLSKSIILNYWFYQQIPPNIHYNSITNINRILFIPSIISLYLIYGFNSPLYIKVLVGIFCFDPITFKFLLHSSSFFHPRLREGYNYNKYLKSNPLEKLKIVAKTSLSQSEYFIFQMGINGLIMIKEKMVQNRLDKHDGFDLILQQLYSDLEFIAYFKNNYPDYYTTYASYFNSNDKLNEVYTKGAEIAAIVINSDNDDTNDKYSLYLKKVLSSE